MNPKHKIYHVISLGELRELVRIAEASAATMKYELPDTSAQHCIILRGHLSSGRNSIAKSDGARQVSRLAAREQCPELFPS